MDLNYRILWFEDTDESFETLGRRTQRYVESQNLKCCIDRIKGAAEFEEIKPNINLYEILVVDLKLSEDSKGYDIIETIRQGQYVNDVLFYSSEGEAALEDILKQHRLEGVFITDRKNAVFMGKIQKLIDKSIRRSENVINIRGIVLDETSEFDVLMCDITKIVCTFIGEDEIASLKSHMVKVLEEYVSGVGEKLKRYSADGKWDISKLLDERDFNSNMKARTLNYILKNSKNPKIVQACEKNKGLLPEIYDSETIRFVDAFTNDISQFRNKLAHVKDINTTTPLYIGNVNGKDYYCDGEFCAMMRNSLIKYGKWLKSLYSDLSM